MAERLEATETAAKVAVTAKEAVPVRARVTEIEVTDLFDLEDEGWGRFFCVYPSSSGMPLAELRLYEGDDIEQWFDDTGYDWPQEMREALRRRLPRPKNVPPRPVILVAGLELPDQRERAIGALTAHNQPPTFFRRGGLVTEVVRNEKGVPKATAVTTVRMRDRLGEVAEWVNQNRPTKPPTDLAANLLETPGLHLPPLESIVEFPVIGRDGRISSRRGYDPEARTYFAPSMPIGRLNVPGFPTGRDVKDAKRLLAELLADFPFANHSDKTNTLALALTPIVRPLIEGPVPLAAIRATKAGTGKTLIVRSILRILTGREPGFTMLGRDEDEAEKRLVAALLAGGQFIVLDNVKTGKVLDSAALAMALTAQVWDGRIIQTSRYPSLSIRCTWVATGNNLTMSDGIARRSYMIELESRDERPDLRPLGAFRHPDLVRWISEKRPALLSALLTVARTWSADGMKLSDGPVLSTFEEWSLLVGSILRRVGLDDFLGNEDRKRDIAEDETNLEREVLLFRMQEAMGDRDFTIRELHEQTQLGEHAADMAAAAQPFLGPRTSWQDEEAVKQLGYAVRTFRDGVYGGLKLVKVGKDRRRGAVYRIAS